MSKIAIVTDSTAKFPHKQIGTVPIHTIPLQCIWGNDIYRDGVDIKIETFYDRLKTASVLPSTSQPSPNDFKNVYDKLLAEGYQILTIVISSKLSGTMNSAVQAKNMLRNAPIEIFDSLTTSVALHFQIDEAAKAINQGANMEEAIQVIKSVQQRSSLYFTVETLEYLERGGRLSKMEAMAGNVLQIRPILTLIDGKIEAKTKTRTFKRAAKMVADQVKEDLKGKKLVGISGIYSDNIEFCQDVMEKTSKEIAGEVIENSFVSPISPVIGTHTGPGAFGLAYLFEE
ncbi:MAG: DegV family protein [Anaerolineaceae bacterium]|nr:DegV family protein [Anaerolineaceae bacterium]